MMMGVVTEYFWPDGERPGWALRWHVDKVHASVDVCSATGCSMWCEDLQLGTAGDAAALCDLFQHIYERAEVLIGMAERNAL